MFIPAKEVLAKGAFKDSAKNEVFVELVGWNIDTLTKLLLQKLVRFVPPV